MLGHGACVETAANIEFGSQAGKSRLHSANELIEYLVGDGLMERALIPKRPDVKLERFQFDAEAFWNIFELEHREIRLTCLRTQTGELR